MHFPLFVEFGCVFRWLRRCHKEDREYLFLNRDFVSSSSDPTIFKTLKFRNQDLELKTGDQIKLKSDAKNSPVIFGEVVSFVVNDRLSSLEVSFFVFFRVTAFSFFHFIRHIFLVMAMFDTNDYRRSSLVRNLKKSPLHTFTLKTLL